MQICNVLHITDARSKHWKRESACLYLVQWPEQLNLSNFFGGVGGGEGLTDVICYGNHQLELCSVCKQTSYCS